MDVEPGAVRAALLQGDTHGVAAQQPGQPLVDCQELVALEMQQLVVEGKKNKKKPVGCVLTFLERQALL